MDWCEKNDIQYLVGLFTNPTLAAQVYAKAGDMCVLRALGNLGVVRDFTETSYAARSWSCARRVVARIEAKRRGLDVRYVVTDITHYAPQWPYSSLCCARGQAENLIVPVAVRATSSRSRSRWPMQTTPPCGYGC